MPKADSLTHGHGQHKIHIKPVNYQPHVLLYHNIKFYWRFRIDLDTYVYLYPEFSVVEIVSYNRDEDRELNRVYLNAEKLFDELEDDSIEDKMNEESKKLETMRMKQNIKPKMDKEGLRELVKRELIVPYIDLRLSLQRTKLNHAKERIVTPPSQCERCIRCIKCLKCSQAAIKRRQEELRMKQEKHDAEIAAINAKGVLKVVMTTFTDKETLDYVLDKPPLGLQPITIAHKKKVTVEDFHQSLDNLKIDTQNLNKASEVALSLAGLAKKSVEGFQNATSRAKLDPNLYTRAQYRWKNAIHRIILQNAVAMYTEQWNRSIHNPANHSQHGYTIAANRQGLGTALSENRIGSPTRRRPRTNDANGINRSPRASFPLLASDDSTECRSSRYSKHSGGGRRLQTKSFASVCESPYFPPIDENGSVACDDKIDGDNHRLPFHNSIRTNRATFDLSSLGTSSASNLSSNSRYLFDGVNSAEMPSPVPPMSKLMANALDIMSIRNHYTGGISNEQQLEAIREKAIEHQRRIANDKIRSDRRSFVAMGQLTGRRTLGAAKTGSQ